MQNTVNEVIAKMTLKNSYWGYLFNRVRRVDDPTIPTMGVGFTNDGIVQLYYNSDVIKNTDPKIIEKILEHEGMHLLSNHLIRHKQLVGIDSTKYKHTIFNQAADCCVNQAIDMPSKIMLNGNEMEICNPETLELPPDKTTEWYYNELMKKNEEEGEGNGEGMVGDHSKWGEGKGVSKGQLENEIKSVIQDVTDAFKKRGGHIDGHLGEMLAKFMKKPKLPYYQIIKKFVKNSRYTKYKRHFAKINRKRTYVFNDSGIPQISPFPGRTRDLTFDITVVIDTSGSMSNKDILEGLSGIKNIIENDKNCKVNVIEIDTVIRKEYEITKLSDIQFDIKGRGGTTLGDAFSKIKESYNTDLVLVFTDGYCEKITRSMVHPKTVWVVQKSGTTEMVEGTGFIVRVDED